MGRQLNTYKITNQDVSLPPGEYLTFIYEAKMEGVKTEIDLISNTIDIMEKKPVITPPNFLRLLSNVEGEDLPDFDPFFDANIYFDMARDLIEDTINKKHKEVETENEFKVESRIKALEKSSDIRIRNLEQRIDNHFENRRKEGLPHDEVFIRLTQGRIAKERERLAERTELLAKQRDLTLDYSLEGLLYIKIGGGIN